MLPKSFFISGKQSEKISSFASFEKNSFALSFGQKEEKNLIEKSKKLKTKNPFEELKKLIIGYIKTPNISVGIFKDNLLYLLISGNFVVALKRNGNFHILAAQEEKPKYLSGEILPEDEYFLCSGPCLKFLEESVCKNFDDIPKSLAEKIQKQEKQEEICALLIKFQNPVLETNTDEKEPNAHIKNQLIKPISFLSKINQKTFKITLLALLFALLIVLIVAILNNTLKISKKTIEEETKKIENIKKTYENASELLNLNNVRSGELAKKALTEIQNLNINSLKSNENKKQIEDLINSLNKLIKESSNITESKAEIVYSTNLLQKNSEISQISALGNEIIIALNSKQNSLYKINIKTKKTDVFDLKKYISKGELVAANENYAYVFSQNGIAQIDFTSNKIKTVVKNETSWGEISDIALYSDNIYLLDKKNNQVWKILKENDAFSLGKPYFESEKPKKVASFAIDSNVYILSENNISKYLSGEKQNFILEKVPDKPLKNPVKILTSKEDNNIYLLEPAEKRIILFDKKGNYIKQIVDNRLFSTKTFAVDENKKTIYFPLKSDIYQLTF